jgi:hypothetical protein
MQIGFDTCPASGRRDGITTKKTRRRRQHNWQLSGVVPSRCYEQPDHREALAEAILGADLAERMLEPLISVGSLSAAESAARFEECDGRRG